MSSLVVLVAPENEEFAADWPLRCADGVAVGVEAININLLYGVHFTIGVGDSEIALLVIAEVGAQNIVEVAVYAFIGKLPAAIAQKIVRVASRAINYAITVRVGRFCDQVALCVENPR